MAGEAMTDSKGKGKGVKAAKDGAAGPVLAKAPKVIENKAEALKKDLVSRLDTIECRVDEMGQAWDGIVQGLELRTKERYARASKKLSVVRDTLKEQAVVDLRNIGKVMVQLNRKVRRGMPSKGISRMKDILDIEEVFKNTTSTLDNIVDDRVHGNLRELQNRLDSIFKARMKAMVDLDKKAKASLESAHKAARELKGLVPSATEASLERLSKATHRIYKEVSAFSVKKVRAKKKDLARLDKTIRDMNKEVAAVLRKWPGHLSQGGSKPKGVSKPKARSKPKSKTTKA